MDAYERLWQLIVSSGTSLTSASHPHIHSALFEVTRHHAGKFFDNVRALMAVNPTVHMWQLFVDSWVELISFPCSELSDMLQWAHYNGLNINHVNLYTRRSLLVDALFSFWKNTHNHSGWKTMRESGHASRLCVVQTLVQCGADIYWINPKYFDHAFEWLELMTPSMYACGLGLLGEWYAALQECGLDPVQVIIEDEKRRREAFRLRGAKRTGIDEEALDLPSFTGLRRRICFAR